MPLEGFFRPPPRICSSLKKECLQNELHLWCHNWLVSLLKRGYKLLRLACNPSVGSILTRNLTWTTLSCATLRIVICDSELCFFWQFKVAHNEALQFPDNTIQTAGVGIRRKWKKNAYHSVRNALKNCYTIFQYRNPNPTHHSARFFKRRWK